MKHNKQKRVDVLTSVHFHSLIHPRSRSRSPYTTPTVQQFRNPHNSSASISPKTANIHGQFWTPHSRHISDRCSEFAVAQHGGFPDAFRIRDRRFSQPIRRQFCVSHAKRIFATVAQPIDRKTKSGAKLSPAGRISAGNFRGLKSVLFYAIVIKCARR